MIKRKKEKKHTVPLVVSDSWRVQAFVRLIEPSLKDTAIPVVAVECSDKLLERGTLKMWSELSK